MIELPMASAVAAKALDGLSMRMAAIAQNIAGANSPTFRPMTLNFETALREAVGNGRNAVDGLQFSFGTGPMVPAGEDRRLDLALSDAAETANRFEALADMIGRRLSIQRALTEKR